MGIQAVTVHCTDNMLFTVHTGLFIALQVLSQGINNTIVKQDNSNETTIGLGIREACICGIFWKLYSTD